MPRAEKISSLTLLLVTFSFQFPTRSHSQVIGILHEPSCVVPKIANGTISITGSVESNGTLPETVLSGTEISLHCDEGFVPVSDITKFVCQDEFVWSNAKEISCKQSTGSHRVVAKAVSKATERPRKNNNAAFYCVVPMIENGTIAIFMRNERLRFVDNGTTEVRAGVKLLLACNGVYYRLVDGASESFCRDDGTWWPKIGTCQYILLPTISIEETTSSTMMTTTVNTSTNNTAPSDVEKNTSTVEKITETTTVKNEANETTAEPSEIDGSELVAAGNVVDELLGLNSNWTNFTATLTSTELNTSAIPVIVAGSGSDSNNITTLVDTGDEDDRDNIEAPDFELIGTTSKSTNEPNFTTTEATMTNLERFFAAIGSKDYEKVVSLYNQSHDIFADSFNNATDETPLMAAVRAGSVSIVEFFLNRGADVEVKDRNGQTAIMVAAKTGVAPIVEMLLYANPEIEGRDLELGRTPLLWAASFGHLDAVKHLVERGADIMVRSDSDGKEDADGLAIHLAAAKGYVDVVDYFLGRNRTALIEARNEKFETPLMVAAKWGKINVVGRLVHKYGAPLETRTPYNKTALMKAIGSDHIGVVRLLVRTGANISTKCIGKRTGLHVAVEHDLIGIAKFLASTEPKLMEEINSDGNSPLFIAAHSGVYELVKFFLEKGASVAKSGHLGRTAIHAAAVAGHVDIVQLLGEKQRSRIWAQSKPEDNGDMAIHLAIRNHHLDVVKAFVRLDEQQIEAQNLHGHTPLQLATLLGDASIACYIAGLKSDKEMRDGSGQTPLIVAASLGNAEIVKCLVEGGANATSKSSLQDSGNTPLHAAAVRGSLDVIKYLVQNVSHDLLELRDATGGTPLISAVSAGQLDAAKALIELGAYLETTTYLGIKTALWVAASNGEAAIAEYLVSKGANTEAIGEYGRTPLLAAAAAGHLDVTKFLVENGANWRAVSGEIDGLNTALHLASAFGHFDVSRYLAAIKPELVNVTNKRGHTAAQLATLLWNKNIYSASVRRYQSNNNNLLRKI